MKKKKENTRTWICLLFFCITCIHHRLNHVRLAATPWTVDLPGSSIHGILQARILEWVAI